MNEGDIHPSLTDVGVGGPNLCGVLSGAISSGAIMDVQPKLDDASRLLAASAGGDRAAFASLYQLASKRLFAVSLRIVDRRDWAEEVVQEAFVRIWRRASSFDSERGGAMAWMVTITRNLAIDRLRHERTQTTESVNDGGDGKLTEPSADLMDDILRNDASRALERCLRTLGDEPRRAILLAYCWGYSYDELSQVFDAPANTVKSWTRRGLLRLRVCLSQ